MFTAAGQKSGLIGTIEVCYDTWQQKIRNTTPESYELYEILRKMVDQGCQYVVMEVSSQALKLHRVDGIMFEAAVFTNLREDHIRQANMQILRSIWHVSIGCSVSAELEFFNQDDPYWQEMWRQQWLSGCYLWIFRSGRLLCRPGSQLFTRASDRLGVQYHLQISDRKKSGTESGEGASGKQLECGGQCAGQFSIYNSLAAISVAEQYQIPEERDGKSTAYLAGARTHQMLPVSPRFIVIVDYAHNAMALDALLTTLQDYHPGGSSAFSDAAVTVRQNDGFKWEKWQEDWRILWW